MMRLTLPVLAMLFVVGCYLDPAPPPKSPEIKTTPAEVLMEISPDLQKRRVMYTIEILKTSGNQPYHWRVKASNGQILLTSEKYVDNPFRTVDNFTKVFQRGTFKVEDLTK